ncbi:TOMM precursor leader peptide-binding protein [Nonomuraea fuscirosea]|uniref:TOMM precursor leader peptide-binding protein n=1 Tax=Nonomuraea fuscirosea TaxID=1291556 RepID=UPI003438303E
MVVVALSRADLRLCERAAEQGLETGVPWLPVVLDGLAVRIGPLVRPGCPPCLECLRRRQTQHDTQKSVSVRLALAYESVGVAGPQGFLPHHVRMAASVVSMLLQDLDAAVRDRDTSGEVVTIDLLACSLSRHAVIECDDCRFCGRTPERSVHGLRLTVAAALERAGSGMPEIAHRMGRPA